MAPERLSKFLNTDPFRPFVIHVGDGRALEVNDPGFAVLIGEKGRSLLLTTDDDSSHLIDVFLITGVEVKSGRRWDGLIEVIS